MDGILVINKEENMTSRDVVNIVCKKLNTKKIGHTGTLDPMAKGVLVLCVNKALKLVEDITSFDKEYIAKVTLGLSTDTLDITGNITNKKIPKHIEKDKIISILESFKGEYNMEVPKYSAIKVNGKKLYEYARNNEEVILPVRKVFINDINLINDVEYMDETINFSFKCNVSKGTYIRSLIRDICEKLGEEGTMSELIRTRQGNFNIEESINLNELNNETKLINMKDAIDYPLVEVDEFLYKKIKNGSKLQNRYNYDKFGFVYKNNLIAIYTVDKLDNKKIKPVKVLI